MMTVFSRLVKAIKALTLEAVHVCQFLISSD